MNGAFPCSAVYSRGYFNFRERYERNTAGKMDAAMIAGIIILFIDLYCCIVKAGIPYQDPPMDLWIQYEVNARIGDILVANGFKIAICSGIIRLLLGVIWKKCERK